MPRAGVFSESEQRHTSNDIVTDAPVRGRGFRQQAALLGELCGLSALGLALPALDQMAATPEFLPSRHITRVTVVVFVLLTLAVVPAVLMGIELVAGSIRPRMQSWVHFAWTLTLLSLIALNIGSAATLRVQARLHVSIPGPLVLASAIAVGTVGTVLISRWPPARATLRLLAVAPVVVAFMFFLRAPLGQPEVSAAIKTFSRPAPVVLVVFDEFPAASLLDRSGSLDTKRLPNFARLARDATWWTDATTVADTTPAAVPAILSGTRPTPRSAPTLAAYPQNIFTLLRGTYREDAFEPITDLCPEAVCHTAAGFGAGLRGLFADGARLTVGTVAPPDLRDGVPKVVGRDGVVNDPDLEIDRFLRRLTTSSHSTLHVLHVLLPHHPWNHHATGVRYRVASDPPCRGLPRGFENPDWIPDPDLIVENWRRHLDQVGYVDRLLGRVLDRLKTKGLYERTLLAVVADHGISFRPGQKMRWATENNLGEIASVPLFIKRPGQHSGRTITGRADTTALLPTILDILGAKTPEVADSLLRGPSGGPVRVNSSSGRVVQATVSGVRRQRHATLQRQASVLRG